MNDNIEFSSDLIRVFEDIKAAKGTPFLVGGAVRDWVMGRVPHDFDFEVHDISADTLAGILSKHGAYTYAGVVYGIYHFTTHSGEKYEFALPRSEKQVGDKHTDIEVTLLQSSSMKKAAERRDFSINAMMMDVFTGEIYDFFNGMRGITDKVIVATSSETFTADPLRMLRACRFAAQLDFSIDSLTADLISVDGERIQNLVKDTLWKEFVKWAATNFPEKMLYELKNTCLNLYFPSLDKLHTIMQNPLWHPEGDVFEHTCKVVRAASMIRHHIDNEEDKICLMLTALCHDFGKIVTTVVNERGVIVAPGHAEAGVALAKDFLLFIGAPNAIIERVLILVEFHMHLTQFDLLWPQLTKERFVRRLSNSIAPVSIKMLLLLTQADWVGRGTSITSEDVKILTQVDKIAKSLSVMTERPKPIINGGHLIAIGRSPSPEFKKILSAAYSAQLDGEFSDPTSGITWVMKWIGENL